MTTLPPGVTFIERGWLSSNSILLQDETSTLLIDTGYCTHADQTLQLVTDVLGDRPLQTIINTHLHSDHCGGNATLQKYYSKVETLIPVAQAELIDIWDVDALTYKPTGQHCPRFIRTGTVQNGDAFTVNGAVWQAYAASGHDQHAFILFNTESKVLISADALWENGFGVVFPEIEGIQAFDQVESTLQMIEQLNPTWILPGHGAGFGNIHAALGRARSRLKQFRSSPSKHGNYAAKVLLKFKLLEIQTLRLPELLAWAETTSYLQMLRQEYAANLSFGNWFDYLCRELEKSGACHIANGRITNT